MSDPTRRRFLELMGGTALGALSGCSSGPDSVGDVAAGSAADLAVGTVRAVGSEPVAIGRDAKGIYAMTLTCTHQGCNIGGGTVSGAGLKCPCHGSTFDANGDVTGGPATSPLAHLSVTADASGNLTIHGGTVVDASTRLTV
jgi:Rieske Fe-S protein